MKSTIILPTVLYGPLTLRGGQTLKGLENSLVTCVRGVLGSNIGWGTLYHDWDFLCGSPESLQVNCGTVFWNRPWPLPFWSSSHSFDGA